MEITSLKKIVFTGVAFAVSLTLAAQEHNTTLVNHLQNSNQGGKVTIHQDARLNARMGKFGEGSTLERINNVSYIVTPGYRIQVYSGNDQRRSKQEASQKEKQIKEIDPQMETYITFNAPVWRLRVGNFRTYEEADARLRLLKRELPKMGKEMYIVQDNVRFPIYGSSPNASDNP